MIDDQLETWLVAPGSELPLLSPALSHLWYDPRKVSSFPGTAFGLFAPVLDPEMKAARAFAALSFGTAGLMIAACPSHSPGLPELATALRGLRLVQPRLTGGFAYAPCGPMPEEQVHLFMPHCSEPPRPGTPRYRVLARMVARITQRAQRERSAAALHTYGVALLLWNPDAQQSVARAVALLEEASALAPEDARILSDLAAAYLVFAQRAGRPEDLVHALARARQAVEKDGSLLEARFNEALVLQALHLRSGAAKAWEMYRRLDSGSAWGAEARDHLRVLDAADAVTTWNTAETVLDTRARRGDGAGVRAIIKQFPQTVRLHLEEKLLADWAEAVAGGRAAEAKGMLQTARTIAVELERHGGDRLPSEAVAALEKAAQEPEDGRLAALVAGHLAYREGLELYAKFEIGPAAERFEAARQALLRGESPFWSWTEFYLAVCSLQRSEYSLALSTLARLQEEALRKDYPNLAGRALWVMGLCYIGRAQPVEAHEAYQRALAAFGRSREVESLTSVHALIADALRYLGEERLSWGHRYQALRGLAGLRDVRRRHAIVGEAAMAALEAGEPLGAIAFQDEAVELAESSQEKVDLTEALRSRAAIHLQVGNTQAALTDLKEAKRKVTELGDVRLRQIVAGRILEVEARLGRTSSPERSAALLTEAEALFRGLGYRFPLVRIYAERAQVRQATGDRERAAADLRAAIREIEAEADEVLRALRNGEAGSLPGELSLQTRSSGQGQDPFDQLLLMLAMSHEDRAAWELAERAQAHDFLSSLLSLPSGPQPLGIPERAVRPLPADVIQRQIPGGTAVLQYELLEDHLLIWLAQRGRLRLWITQPGRSGLAPWIARVRAGLSNGRQAPAAEVEAGLERLFEALVAPALEDLAGIDDLVFIPDGVLHDVPFAALLSPTTGRYLVEDRTVAVAPSATTFVESLQRDQRLSVHADLTALAVGDPSYDHALFPTLPSLRYAGAEAAQVARIYPGSDLLQGPHATKARFLALAGRHGIVHAAAHAVTRRDSPLVSTLVLAAGGNDSGALYAHELLGLRFPSTRLVVLSACSTAGGQRAGRGGAAGFVRPLLAAGVPTVVASLWPVDDRATARLFATFHERFRAGDSASAALQAAQLALLREGDSSLRAPAMWAGFEVFGGAARTKQNH